MRSGIDDKHMHMHIWFDPHRCRGCLRCELACSFHHNGHTAFQPTLSSTTVLRDNDTKRITMTIDGSCDSCTNEPGALCVQHCVFGARGVAP